MIAVSFRLWLALATASLAAVALAGFGSIAWWQMRQERIAAIDREFLQQAEREMSRHWPADHWPRHELRMAGAFGAEDAAQCLLLVLEQGREIYRSRHWPADLNPRTLPWPAANQGQSDFAEPLPSAVVATRFLEHGGRTWRFGLASTRREQLAIGVDLGVVDTALAPLRDAFFLAAPLALGFIGLGAWLLSGRALAPLLRLTTTMEGLTARDLSQRLPLDREAREIHRLIEVVNGMLERLERSFQQASRFSADAAHELKTPLAILQGQIEQSMGRCEPGSLVQADLSRMLDEVQRLGMISRKLVLLSLADAGRLRLQQSEIDLSRVLEELAEDAKMLAEGMNVSVAVTPGLTVAADKDLLTQLLHNLLSNAVKHNLPQGWIRLTATRQNAGVEVAIANSAPDLSAADREHLFDRFYRADEARSKHVEGAGLGLGLAREIARAHGGELRLAEPLAGELRLVLWLPANITNL